LKSRHDLEPAWSPTINIIEVPARSGKPTAVAESTPKAIDQSEIVVFRVRRPATCGECSDDLSGGRLLRREGDGVLCLACADLDGLDFLPTGDAALTRRARKYSTLQAVVVEWSRSRKRYERQGVLVEPAALHKAEEECLADADLRARQRLRAALQRDELDQSFVTKFVAAIQSSFPGCPAAEAEQIANHACQRSSGRIGRTAAAREFDPEAIRLAVIAHVRHTHTNYDRLLNQLCDRADARDQVREGVKAILDQWTEPTQPRPPRSSSMEPESGPTATPGSPAG
jgi:hypothetical protein